MVFQKLLKLSIMDALDDVWAKSGITPSKKTRETIINAAAKISSDVQEDFMKAKQKAVFHKEELNDRIVRNTRRSELTHIAK